MNYVFFADGFEEIEALTAVDVMRRAGMPVTTVSINPFDVVTGAHGVVVSTDAVLDGLNMSDAQWLVLPGGMPGATNLLECDELAHALVEHNRREGRIAAICASPAVVLAPLGILDGKRAVCYPGMEVEGYGAEWCEALTMTSGNVITGSSPGAAMQFALAIVAATPNTDAATVAAGMVLDR